MKYFTIFLILIGFTVLVSNAFASCISLPCDDANIKLGEPNYRFIDFSYQNKVGEPIKFILEKTAYGSCNSFKAKITDEDGNLVWGEGSEVLCAHNENPSLVTSQIKIGYNIEHHIIINEPGRYYIKIEIDDGSIEREFVVHHTNSAISLDRTVYPAPWERGPPLKQYKDGFAIADIYCKGDLVLIQKYDGSPACVKPVTKQHLIDRGWAKTVELNEIKNNPDLLKLNIVRIEDGRVSLHPENTCASLHLDLLSENDIERYRNDEMGLDETNILKITADDLIEIPKVQELIYAVQSVDFPYNKYSSVYLDGPAFVEYEFFLMEKAIKKYGDSKEDYFIKLDDDYTERFADPAKQGFSNTFEAPIIVYNDNAYSVDGTVFWTSDEHEPMRMGVYPKDVIEMDEKFITLTEDDMKSIPKIKEGIEGIGTIKESITGFKGLPENEWNQYREWFEQKSQDQLGTDWFRLIEYNDQLYSIGFSIC